jgi:uncharacterized RDD family membrane protein YckC
VSELTPYPRGASKREEVQVPTDAGVVYSGWWRRGGALIIDNLLLVAIAAIFFALAFLPNDTLAGIAIVLAILFWFVFPFVYFTYFHGKTGQTIGKRALGIRVVHAERRDPIGYGPAFGRYAMVFVFSIFTIPLLLDYLFPLWDSRNQSLHDKVVSSIVVRA